MWNRRLWATVDFRQSWSARGAKSLVSVSFQIAPTLSTDLLAENPCSARKHFVVFFCSYGLLLPILRITSTQLPRLRMWNPLSKELTDQDLRQPLGRSDWYIQWDKLKVRRLEETTGQCSHPADNIEGRHHQVSFTHLIGLSTSPSDPIFPD